MSIAAARIMFFTVSFVLGLSQLTGALLLQDGGEGQDSVDEYIGGLIICEWVQCSL